MTPVVLTERGVGIAEIVAVALHGAKVEIAPSALEHVAWARAALDRAAASGQPIYGLNTGLGANLKTSVAGDPAAFQQQLIAGRGGAVGAPLPAVIVRATMAARAAALALGGSGISPHVLVALVDALNAGVLPVMPSLGSIGAGDLVLMASLARMLVGEGEAEFNGRRMAAVEALAAAGLGPVELAPKDGLSLINSSSVSTGHAALAVHDVLETYGKAQQAAALTMEGIGANRAILDPRLHAARPGFGQEAAAGGLRALLEGGAAPVAASIQDPLSIRCLPSIHGVLLDAAERARAAVEIELTGKADNPLVLDDGTVMSSGNFHTAAPSIAFEALGLAVAQAAAASAARFIQLTGSGRNGLPKYLSPVGGASAGFVPLQKTATSILAAIRQRANPVMLDFLPVSEGVEDHAAQTPLVVAKCDEMIALWRRLVTFEMLAAAQAADLRDGLVLAPRTQAVRAAVRAHSAMLQEDRSLGPEAEALYAALSSGKWQA
jgi:histidine ammonia-lyase